MRKPESSLELSAWDNISSEIDRAEQLLQEIKQRLEQVKTAQAAQPLLQQQKQDLIEQRDRRKHEPEPIQAELQEQLAEVTSQLEAIEIELESRLFSWKKLPEPFWQIVRFVGLGILIGVLIKSCAS